MKIKKITAKSILKHLNFEGILKKIHRKKDSNLKKNHNLKGCLENFPKRRIGCDMGNFLFRFRKVLMLDYQWKYNIEKFWWEMHKIESRATFNLLFFENYLKLLKIKKKNIFPNFIFLITQDIIKLKTIPLRILVKF